MKKSEGAPKTKAKTEKMKWHKYIMSWQNTESVEAWNTAYFYQKQISKLSLKSLKRLYSQLLKASNQLTHVMYTESQQNLHVCSWHLSCVACIWWQFLMSYQFFKLDMSIVVFMKCEMQIIPVMWFLQW